MQTPCIIGETNSKHNQIVQHTSYVDAQNNEETEYDFLLTLFSKRWALGKLENSWKIDI